MQAVVAQEFHLPHRTLKPVWLGFQPGERAFYEQARPLAGWLGAAVLQLRRPETPHPHGLQLAAAGWAGLPRAGDI